MLKSIVYWQVIWAAHKVLSYKMQYSIIGHGLLQKCKPPPQCVGYWVNPPLPSPAEGVVVAHYVIYLGGGGYTAVPPYQRPCMLP